MTKPIEQVIEIIAPHNDSLVPIDCIKECIAHLEQSDKDYSTQIALLRGQIGICNTNDTQFFSRQLTANKLIEALRKPTRP